MKIFYITCILCACCIAVYGQSARGIVYDAKAGEPVADVIIQVQGFVTFYITGPDGRFELKLPADRPVSVTFRRLGYASKELSMTTSFDDVIILMEEESFELNEITVTASEQQLGSVSEIGRLALRHTQSTNLFDALQLVPGQLAVNPSFANPLQFTIRQASVGAAAERMNALGTALFIDGVPVSNNANLQINQNILNSRAGSLPPFSSVAGRGNDLRQFPADNVESIEVIRGIPSARFGDLTAGAVIVNTVAGAYAPRLLLRLNPTLQQVSGGYGIKLSANHAINVDGDIARAQDDPRDELNLFTRVNTQATWTYQNGKRWSITNRFLYNTILDQSREDLSQPMVRSSRFSRENFFKVSSRARWNAEQSWSDYIEVTASTQYVRQDSYFQDLVTRDIFPVTARMVEGTAPGEYGRSEYLNQTNVEGRPLMIYARAESFKSWNAKTGRHTLTTGSEWRLEQNNGSGRQFDPRTPPRQNYQIGDRPRSYADVPSLIQAGWYMEDRLATEILGHNLLVSVGLRYDQLIRESNDQAGVRIVHSNLNPRVNAAYQMTPWLSWRAGWGRMTKVPTLSHLYPNPVFVDLVNLNYFANNPAERLVVLTTNIIRPETDQLRPYVNTKAEIGADLTPQGGWRFTFSLFNEQMNDAYQAVRFIKPLENAKYEAVEFPQGQPPVLNPIPVAIDTFMAGYDRTVNNLQIINRGFDFTIESPRINGHTTLQLSGGFFHSKSIQTDRFVDADRAIFSNQFSGRIPVYSEGQATEALRLNSAARIIHHIPEFGMVLTGMVQTIWLEQNRLQAYEQEAVAYIDRSGAMIEITTDNPYAGELRRDVSPLLLTWQKRPPVWLLNIRVSKDWSNGTGFAFFVNNLFNTRPLYQNISTMQRVLRNQPQFFFGAEVSYAFNKNK